MVLVRKPNRLTWSLFVTLCIHYSFFSSCSSSLLWIHWGSTSMWLLTASRPEKQTWSFAPMKTLWQPCPKTRTTCVCPLLFPLRLICPCAGSCDGTFSCDITLCSWHKTACWPTAEERISCRSRIMAQIHSCQGLVGWLRVGQVLMLELIFKDHWDNIILVQSQVLNKLNLFKKPFAQERPF